MSKKVLMVSVVIATTMLFVGCSESGHDNSSFSDEIEEMEFTYDTDDVSVLFQLQNENGDETYTFNEGENIVFRLELKNSGHLSVILPENRDIVGHDLFRVYSVADAMDKGTPWDKLEGVFMYLRAHSILGDNSSKVYVCPWLVKSETNLSKETYSNFKINGVKPLSAGNYYSEFDIKLSDSQKVTCRREFTIRQLLK